MYKKELVVHAAVSETLLTYPFPGNIRELENLMERLFVLSEKEATVEQLPMRIRQPPIAWSPRLADAEKVHIQKVFQLLNYNIAQTAKALEVSINTLKNKIKKYTIKTS